MSLGQPQDHLSGGWPAMLSPSRPPVINVSTAQRWICLEAVKEAAWWLPLGSKVGFYFSASILNGTNDHLRFGFCTNWSAHSGADRKLLTAWFTVPILTNATAPGKLDTWDSLQTPPSINVQFQAITRSYRFWVLNMIWILWSCPSSLPQSKTPQTCNILWKTSTSFTPAFHSVFHTVARVAFLKCLCESTHPLTPTHIPTPTLSHSVTFPVFLTILSTSDILASLFSKAPYSLHLRAFAYPVPSVWVFWLSLFA